MLRIYRVHSLGLYLRNMAFRALFAGMLLVVVAFARAQAPPSPVTSQNIRRASGFLEMYVDKLPEMPTIGIYRAQRTDHRSSAADITIGMYAKTWKFHRDLPPTRVFAYGTSKAAASVPGPTIVGRRGIPLTIRWENHLPHSHILPWDPTITTAIPKHGGVPTVVHVHGSAHSPSNDGNPLAWFTSGYRETGPHWSQATYTYPNIQPSGNLWYHDHTEGLTRVNILAGLLGVYTVRNSSFDRRLGLPSGHEYDRHIVIFDRSFNTDGSIYVNSTGVYPQLHPEWQPEYFGDAILVNGKAWPYLTVRRRRYRFRILNASNARYLRLSLSNGLPFYIIGSDASYLSSPVRTQTILLGPAEGADVVVDFSRCSSASAEMINDAPYPYPSGTPAGPLTGKVMKFNILPSMEDESPDNSTMPTRIADYCGVTMEDATVRRYIALYEYSVNGKVTHLDINGLHFMDPVTETPRTGSTEIWYVINLTNDNHPLHIHLAMSQAVKVQEIVDLPTFKSCMTKSYDAIKCDIAGHAKGRVIPVPDHEKTWKNVVKIAPGYVTTVVVDFKIPDTKMPYPFDATADPGYVYHCHILEHEDNVMMRPLKLLPGSTQRHV